MTPQPLEHAELSKPRRARKRAGLVCSRCHEKKIKCDLQSLIGQESPRCKSCTTSNSFCRIRSPRRGGARRQQNTHIVLDRPPPISSNGVSSPPLAFRQLIDAAVEQHAAQFLEETADAISRPLPTETGIPLPIDVAYDTSSLAPDPPLILTPGQESFSSHHNQHRQSYLGESGYMQVFSRGAGGGDSTSPHPSQLSFEPPAPLDKIPFALREGYSETYFDYACVWCPVIDRETLLLPEAAESLLLWHSLALCGNQIRPPLLEHASSSEHYNRAKGLFYTNYETSPILRICSTMLFYWWSADPPNVVSMDTAWWWTGTAIRLAQEIGLHREPNSGQIFAPGESAGLRRRIWWTLFARERISSISLGRPCIIDPDYCDVRMVSHDDFPNPADIRTEAFIQWVRLSAIIGRISKRQCQNAQETSSTAPLAAELKHWVQSLPPAVQLRLNEDNLFTFNRDIHGLHLVYLATITLLNLSKSEPPNPLPKASVPAIVAASYIVRIFEDYLARGSVRFLAGQAGWYITVALLALLYACKIEGLAVYAERDFRSLRAALKRMADTWHSAKMFDLGFDNLLRSNPLRYGEQSLTLDNTAITAQQPTPNSMEGLTSSISDMDLIDYFPSISAHTSPLICVLLANNQTIPFADLQWPMDYTSQLHAFLASPADFTFEFPS